MKIYTTQILKKRAVSRETGKETWIPRKSFCKDGNAYLDISRMTGIKWLAPEWKTLKNLKAGNITEQDYKKIYLSLIEKNFRLEPKKLEWLKSLKTVVLACYYKPGNFCHRYILADFLNQFEGNRRLGELPQWQAHHGLDDLKSKRNVDFSQDGQEEQIREFTHMFLKHPETNQPLKTDKEGYKPFQKKPFNSDNWIFQGTQNEPDINDTFNVLSSSLWDAGTDLDNDKRTVRACKNTIPLNFGEIGAIAISKKFQEGNGIATTEIFNNYHIIDDDLLLKEEIKNKFDRAYKKDILNMLSETTTKTRTQKAGQLNRQIWEDCSKTGDGIKTPQINGGTSKKSPLESIMQYAGIKPLQASTVKKCYKELDITFNIEKKLNMAIKKRKVFYPWDINIDATLRDKRIHMANSSRTLLDWTFELKHIDIIAELKELNDPIYEEWTYYDDGIFNFKILDDAAANFANGLQEIKTVSYNENLPLDKYGDEIQKGGADDIMEYQAGQLDDYVTNDNAGLFTYWNTSTIPTPDELKNKNRAENRRFFKIMGAVLDHKMTTGKIKKLKKFIRKFSPAQKVALKKALVAVA